MTTGTFCYFNWRLLLRWWRQDCLTIGVNLPTFIVAYLAFILIFFYHLKTRGLHAFKVKYHFNTTTFKSNA